MKKCDRCENECKIVNYTHYGKENPDEYWRLCNICHDKFFIELSDRAREPWIRKELTRELEKREGILKSELLRYYKIFGRIYLKI